MIVTLAGHVDHGKTSLVRALTGADTDTLPEEKRRGLTIDLGFAYTTIDGHRIGFVDVPGHHRFIHNMVAGVASHQHALLVVAADDGPMPQTYEHLAILELLGVTHGLAAITKIDRVDRARVAEVTAAVAAAATHAGLRLDRIVGTSAIDGTGLDQIRRSLAEAYPAGRQAPTDASFRLAIDRTFVIKGAGVVVTGTVHSGVLGKGDDIVIAPIGIAARARTLRVSNEIAERATTGDRCAVNLGGVSLEQVARGDWLVAASALAPSHTVTLDLRVLDDFPRPVKHWLPIHAYHATSHARGHVALLESTRLAAGASALVDLVFATPLHPKRGDRMVLRDAGRERTIGGGSVVDIVAGTRGRRSPARLAHVKAQRIDDPTASLRALLAVEDVDVDAFRLGRNLTQAALDAIFETIRPVTLQRHGRVFAVSNDAWLAALDALRAQIAAYHEAAPHSSGLKADQIRRTGIVPAGWLDAALAALVADGRVVESGGHYHEPDHRPALPPDDAALLKRIEALLAESEQPPSTGDMAKSLAIGLRTVEEFVTRMIELGALIRIADKRVLLPRQVDGLAATAQRLGTAQPEGFSAREFRDAARVGRNLAINVLEHFDRCGYTRRYGDLRRIVGAAWTLRRR